MYSGVGLSYASDAFNEDYGVVDGSLKVGSIAISVTSFQGETFGLAMAAAFGLPTSCSLSLGTESVDFSMNLFSTKMHMDAVFGLGYRMVFDSVELILGGGLGYAATMLMPNDYAADSIMYMTLGPGAMASVAYNLSPQMALYASVHGMYGVMQLVETSSVFTSAYAIAPAVGLRFKVR